jgi:GNAT superfamily N-acetyltransferase
VSAKDLVHITPVDRSDYRDLIADVADTIFPEFMHHDPVVNQHWDDLYTCFPEYQFALLDPDTGQVMGRANSLPLAWDGDPADLPGEGVDWALMQCVADHQAGRTPRTQCAILIAIDPAYQGRGLSARFLKTMRSIGAAYGLKRLIAPVRPSLKHRYPLTPMERYIQWQAEPGLPYDPWLRVHARLGAELVKICHQSMRITGTLPEWEAWTGMVFPDSGPYVVPGALVPVEIDRVTDRGVYVEPNVWMVHHSEAE